MAHDKGGISAMRLSKHIRVNRETAWFMLQKLRWAMGDRDAGLTLAGYIELDEAFFGGRAKSKRSKKPPSTGKTQVLVMVESEGERAGNVAMRVIPNDGVDAIKHVVGRKVESDPPGQWIRSDGRGSHHIVMSLGHRIQMGHIPASQQDLFMRCVNLAVSHAKRMFKGTYHQFCQKHIQRYLDEFCYRWNRRDLFEELAHRLLSACVLHSPIMCSAVPAPKAHCATIC
jgi:hypothetical protein